MGIGNRRLVIYGRKNPLLNPDFHDILPTFIDARVDFLVVGGYAMAAHRLSRAAKDLDLWVRPSTAADRIRRGYAFP